MQEMVRDLDVDQVSYLVYSYIGNDGRANLRGNHVVTVLRVNSG